MLKYDFEERCRGGWVRAGKVQHNEAVMRIEPDLGMAWDGSLQTREAAAVADILESVVYTVKLLPIRIGLEEVSVHRTAAGAEITVAGVMIHSKVCVELDHRQAIDLAKCLRPLTPPKPTWNTGADQRRDKLMKGIFGGSENEDSSS